MNSKHTFWTLCNQYDKLEVPIIQRDYAQGRNTSEVIRVRNKFINEFLIDALLNEKKVELDFVYGSILSEKKEDEVKSIFIPLDGQQRLTTLFLLHFFIALKEKRIDEIRNILGRFTYETRPTAHDFCIKLIGKFTSVNLIEIKSEIINTEWYSDFWDKDPTISGMLNMLDTFAKNEQLVNSTANLLDRLLDNNNQLISFYFIALEKFGLTENLYIRMNARGKMLTDFENFKSEFFKIINYNHDLLDEVKDKIEYAWVNNLWDYRGKDKYVVDDPFMIYLKFITEMLYFKQAEFRAAEYESDFLDFKLLKKIYSIEENLKFLIFALDFIKEIKNQDQVDILWKGNSTLHDILQEVVNGKPDIDELFVLFSSLVYFHQNKKLENYYDFIRVLRNLIHNTRDNSRREWPKLIKSLENMIADDNIYDILLGKNFSDLLDGFYVPQRKEEIFKANLFSFYPETKEILLKAEDIENFSGEIANLIISNYTDEVDHFHSSTLDTLDVHKFDVTIFDKVLDAYQVISKNNFNPIWGNLLISSLYSQTIDSRLIYDYNYKKNPAIILFAKGYSKRSDKIIITQYLIEIQKQFIEQTINTFGSLEEIRDVKVQLYLYYLIHIHIYKKGYNSFFKNGFNFGWLLKEKGYKSLFSKGIDNCRWFPHVSPIFQTYKEQFRYNLGINQKNALDIETLNIGNKRVPFKLLLMWAEN